MHLVSQKMTYTKQTPIRQSQILQVYMHIQYCLETQYQVVEQVAQQLGWLVETSKKSQKWDIMWIDSHIQAHDLFKLNDHQKISHFPSIYVLTRKNFLGRSLMKMNKLYPEQYNFFPFTWSIPADYTDLLRYEEKLQKDGCQPQCYIYKPQSMAQGKGIKIYNKTQNLKNKNGIVQIYVNNPFLIQNLKFDLRIYVLILGYDPLRIFIYDEGLGRFATQQYQSVGKKNIRDVYMHLTNYAINKNNRNFIFNTSDRDMDKGHKRSITAIYKYLQSKQIDVKALKDKIDEMIIKTLIVGQPMIAHTYGLAQSDNNYNDLCFQILGFDVLINQKLQPILLEVNHTPSFKTQTPLDKAIKKSLIKDTLVLLNVNVENKKQKLDQKKQFLQMRAQRKLTKLTAQQKEALRIKKGRQREQYESNNLGNYRKIFPLSDSLKKYEDMIQCACKIFNEHHGFKNKKNMKKFNNTSRPKSYQKINPGIPPIMSPIKSKVNSGISYSKTVGMAEQDKKLIEQKLQKKLDRSIKMQQQPIKQQQQQQKQADKFPTITSQLHRPQISHKYSQFMRSIKSEIRKPQRQLKNLRLSKQMKSQSSSPIQKKNKIYKSSITDVGGLEDQLLNKRGSYLAPTLLSLNQIKPRKDTQFWINPSQVIESSDNNSKQMYTNTPIVLRKSGTKFRKFQEVSMETSTVLNKMSPSKLCAYQNLINSLSPGTQIARISDFSINLGQQRKTKISFQLPVVSTKQDKSFKINHIKQNPR